MTALWLLGVGVAVAQDTPWDATLEEAPPPTTVVDLDTPDDGMVTSGLAVAGIGGGSGVGLAQSSVVGGDGGTYAFTSSTRVRWGTWVAGASLPFATYRSTAGRQTGLGNLQLDLFGLDDATDPTAHIGVEVHLPVGTAYTWVNEAEQLWPGAGFNLLYGRRFERDGTTGLVQVSGGLHFTGGYDPYPLTLLKVEVAGVVDQQIAPGVGLVGETSIAYWDPTPLDVAGLVRADPLEGLRLRGGLVLPLLSWTGAQPSTVPAGIREATLHVDVSMAL